ncbi:MAG TPA: retroviral-like aspartic protease family protein [Stellaceae bacterium]|nr:retroviral-like aspartic protease family protein [Stellaceae bacterium]
MFRLAMLTSLVLLALAAGAADLAAAQGCSAPLAAELAVRLLRDMPLVRVAIDGKPATLLLDTGAQDTVLDPAAAGRLGLVGHYEYPRNLSTLGAGIGSGEAATRQFAAGPLDIPGFRVMIGKVSLPELEGIRPDGLLGADFLSQFAVDLDLPDDRLRLYRPGCLAPQPAWRPPYATIAANRSLHDHLFFPVTLDGKRLYAFIDTGAQRSVIDREAALSLGVTAAQLAQAPAAALRGAAAAMVAAPLHRFARLRIGSISVADPVLSVAPLNLDDADIILGEDFIEPRRFWLSYTPPQILVKAP